MRRTLRVALALLLVVALSELGVRLFWAYFGGSFLEAPERIHYYWYPELRRIEEARRDDTFDVLLLGGSVCAALPRALVPALRERNETIRVHRGARPAHTSRDSLNKYRYLDGESFDLVILYHGINDVRANNCPPEKYRDDYTHMAWYRLIDAYESGRPRTFALPYTLRFLGTELGDKTGLLDFLPRHAPKEEWTRYGGVIHSARSLRANYEAIAELAHSRGERLVVPSFVTHFPEDYSEERFREGKLGFRGDGYPVEIWGRPEHVERAIAAHNSVLRELGQRSDVVFLDMQPHVPADPRQFRDICHFSDEGRERFAAALVGELVARDLLP